MAIDNTDILSKGIGSNVFAIGYRTWLRVGSSASDAVKVGFVDSMNVSKNIQVQRAQVCGAIRPASIDPQSYSIQGNMTGFVASPKAYTEKNEINGAGEKSIMAFNPNTDNFDSGTLNEKYDYVDFYDKKKGIIIAFFKKVIITSFRVTVNGGTYVKADVGFEALDMGSGADYMAQTTDDSFSG